MRDPQLRAELAERGVYFPLTAVLAHDGTDEQRARFMAWRGNWHLAADANPHLITPDLRIAMDTQPTMVTTPSVGIPLLFASIVDPEVIRVLFTPMRAVEIMGGEAQKGSWIDQVIYFPMVEPTGQVATYGDYSMNGAVDANANWTPRQPYHWQAFKRYGEKQLARYGAAGLNYAGELDMAMALTFAKFANKAYFYGISGLTNYGLLNDPSLTSAVSPLTKAITTDGVRWTYATVVEQFNDVMKLYGQLVTQMGGNVEMTDTMVLAVSTTLQPKFLKTNDFGVTMEDMLKRAFPNLTIKAAPEYATGSGELMQLILPSVDGVRTAMPAYTEKQRAHAMVTEPSAWSQKQSGGTWGTIIRRPIAIAQMIGL